MWANRCDRCGIIFAVAADSGRLTLDRRRTELKRSVEPDESSMDPKSLFSVAGKVAVITGASGGIGTALVKGFADLDAKVIAVDIVDPRELPAGAAFCLADLRDSEAIADIARDAEASFGTLVILIMHAGPG